jgi:thioesterase domain-containing protein
MVRNDVEAAGPVRPRDVIEQQLCSIWGEVLEVREVGINDDFFELGGTSLEAAIVAARIKKAFGREIGLNTFFEKSTVAEHAEILRNDPDARIPTVVALREQGRRPPLFVFPGAAGNVIALRDLILKLPADQPVYGIEGKPIAGEAGSEESRMDGDASVYARIEEIAAAHVADIRKIQPQGPYYLAGLCFGALLTLEMAKQIAAAGEEVAFVGLLDPPVPGLSRRAHDPASLLKSLRRLIRKSWPDKLHALGSMAHSIKEALDARCTRVLLALFPSQSIPSRLRERRSLALQAVMRYAPSPYPGKLSILLAETNGVAHNEHAEAEWRKLGTESEFEIVPGTHGDFFREPHVGVLTELLLRFLEPAQARSGRYEPGAAVTAK